jgi:hypothetical protein
MFLPFHRSIVVPWRDALVFVLAPAGDDRRGDLGCAEVDEVAPVPGEGFALRRAGFHFSKRAIVHPPARCSATNPGRAAVAAA